MVNDGDLARKDVNKPTINNTIYIIRISIYNQLRICKYGSVILNWTEKSVFSLIN